MDDIQKAMAEFAAKQGVTQCPNTGTKEAYKNARRASWIAQEERERSEREYQASERNAENKRFDSEGVFYIGGKQ